MKLTDRQKAILILGLRSISAWDFIQDDQMRILVKAVDLSTEFHLGTAPSLEELEDIERTLRE